MQAPRSSRQVPLGRVTGVPFGLSRGGRVTVVSAQKTTTAAAELKMRILKLFSKTFSYWDLSVSTTKCQGWMFEPVGAAMAALSIVSMYSAGMGWSVKERTLLRLMMVWIVSLSIPIVFSVFSSHLQEEIVSAVSSAAEIRRILFIGISGI